MGAEAVVGVDRDDDLLDGLEALVALERGQAREVLLAARRAIWAENGEFHGLSVFVLG
jgi:hypothetical protein